MKIGADRHWDQGKWSANRYSPHRCHTDLEIQAVVNTEMAYRGIRVPCIGNRSLGMRVDLNTIAGCGVYTLPSSRHLHHAFIDLAAEVIQRIRDQQSNNYQDRK
jgi:hypothetical protein